MLPMARPPGPPARLPPAADDAQRQAWRELARVHGGFDPRAGISLWQKMTAANNRAPLEFLSTHPSSTTRIAQLQAKIPEVMPLYEQARAAGRRPTCKP